MRSTHFTYLQLVAAAGIARVCDVFLELFFEGSFENLKGFQSDVVEIRKFTQVPHKNSPPLSNSRLAVALSLEPKWLRVTKVIYFSEHESSGTACEGAELDSHCEPKVKTDVSCREKLTCH